MSGSLACTVMLRVWTRASLACGLEKGSTVPALLHWRGMAWHDEMMAANIARDNPTWLESGHAPPHATRRQQRTMSELSRHAWPRSRASGVAGNYVRVQCGSPTAMTVAGQSIGIRSKPLSRRARPSAVCNDLASSHGAGAVDSRMSTLEIQGARRLTRLHASDSEAGVQKV